MSEQRTSEYHRLFANLNSAENMVITAQSNRYYYQKLHRIEGDPNNPRVDNTLTIEMKHDETKGFVTSIKLKEGSKDEQILDLHSTQAKELINELMLDSFMTFNSQNPEGEGTGHVLAAVYIQIGLHDLSGIFYTVIGNSVDTATGLDNTYNSRRNIMEDLINSVKKAKELVKPTATLFVTSRDGAESHDFCMTVATDIFNDEGIIEEKLNSKNCIIFDSSNAFFDNNRFEAAREQLCSSFQISVDKLKKCSFYDRQDIFGQIGPRCSDYAAEAYILLNDDKSEFRNMNIANLNENKLKFYSKIAENMNNRYEIYIKIARYKAKCSGKKDDWYIQTANKQKEQIEQDIRHLKSELERQPEPAKSKVLATLSVVKAYEVKPGEVSRNIQQQVQRQVPAKTNQGTSKLPPLHGH